MIDIDVNRPGVSANRLVVCVYLTNRPDDGQVKWPARRQSARKRTAAAQSVAAVNTRLPKQP